MSAAAAVALVATLVVATPTRAQTPETGTCTVAGQPCFGADQQRQLTKVTDEVMARRVAADSLVAAAIRQFVAYWVDYSVALGYTFAFSYLPG